MGNFYTAALAAAAKAAAAAAIVAAAREAQLASENGYSYALSKDTAAIDLSRQGVQVNSSLTPNMVTFWHAWFWSDDMGRRTETETVIPNTDGYNNSNYVKYAGYSNSGYVAVVEVQTKNYFYYLEFDSMSYTVSVTWNTSGGYPYFSAPHWSHGQPISQKSVGMAPMSTPSQLNIYMNKDKAELYIDWINTDPGMEGHRFAVPC